MYGLFDIQMTSFLQVAKLLTDSSVLQFYPTLFVLATEILDMLGDMVWNRIKLRAEFAEDGTRLCSLPGVYPYSQFDCLSLSYITVYFW